MKTNKSLAKEQVKVYEELLQDYGVISEIELNDNPRNKRNPFYTFMVHDPKFPYAVSCEGIKELANILTGMWSAFVKARHDLGMDATSI